MEIRKRALEEERLDMLTSMANLAFTLKSQSRNEESISLMKKRFKLRKQIFSLKHPYTEISLEVLNE